MKDKQHISIAIIMVILLGITLILYHYGHVFHTVVTQLILIEIILGVLFYNKYVIPVTFIVFLLHIVNDGLHLEVFPIEAVIESIVQGGILYLFYYVLKMRTNTHRRYLAVIEATQLGTWEWNLSTNEIIVNEEWCTLLGYSKEELSPFSITTWEELTHPVDLKKSYEMLQKVFHREIDFYDIEIRMKHKNGEYLWIQDRGMVTRWNNQQKPLIMSGTHTNVQTRVKSTEQVKYMHQLLSYIIDHMNSGIAVHDKDLNYIYASKHYCEQYGVSTDIIGKHHYEVFPDLPQKWRDVHQLALKGEVSKGDRDPYPREDGRVDYTRWECRPWYDETNEIAGIIIYTEVITDYVSLEEELRKSRDLLLHVMDHLPIGIAINSVFPRIEFKYMNNQFPNCYQTTREALEKGDFWEAVYEDEKFRNEIKTKVLSDLASNDLSRMHWEDVPLVKKDGTTHYVTAYNTPIPNQNLTISTAINTTKRKELEIALEQKLHEMFIQKEEIEATLLAIGDAVIATDEFGIITNINDIAVNLTGYKKEETIGSHFKNFFSIMNETSNLPIPCPVQRVIETGETVHLENNTVLIAKDGTKRIIEDSAAPIRTLNGSLIGVILVFRDVTEKKHKQQEIEYLSIHDFLTGLYNRRYFVEFLAKNDHLEHFPLGIIMIDVNGLKIINDAYGHSVGDDVLIEISKVLQISMISQGTIFRTGGDEFTVVLTNTSEQELQNFKDHLLEECKRHFIQNITLSVSIGYDIKTDKTTTITKIITNAENSMYRYKIIEGRSARNNTIQAIFQTLTSKFEAERTHSIRVSELCKLMGIAIHLKNDDIKELEIAGLFHDIGKIAVPDNILYKPQKLTSEEFDLIKNHTKTGYHILHAADEYSKLAEYALYHHEHYDGNGYPEGIKGEQIPLFARIIGIADAYEAMTSDRPYRKALSQEQAVSELVKYSGTQFDPTLVPIFVKNVLPQLTSDLI